MQMKTTTKWEPVLPYGENLVRFGTVPGVYVIYLRGAVVYVGQSDNLARRLRSHGFGLPLLIVHDLFRRFWQELGIRIKARPERSDFERMRAEKRLIKRLRPVLNCGDGGRPIVFG